MTHRSLAYKRINVNEEGGRDVEVFVRSGKAPNRSAIFDYFVTLTLLAVLINIYYVNIMRWLCSLEEDFDTYITYILYQMG